MKKYTTLIFDLDGTLAVSKSALDAEMANLFSLASQTLNLAIITGGMMGQIEKQVLDQLQETACLKNIYILPTSGSQMQVYNSENKEWKSLYHMIFSEQQKERVTEALRQSLEKSSFTIDKSILRGEQIEDRDSQITFSALGQQQFSDVKTAWDPKSVKRKEMITYLSELEDEFDVKIGGSTSIDITLKGIDKEYGINMFFKETGLDINEALFIGDQITPGGNDWAATKTEIDTYSTTGPQDTADIIKKVLENEEGIMI